MNWWSKASSFLWTSLQMHYLERHQGSATDAECPSWLCQKETWMTWFPKNKERKTRVGFDAIGAMGLENVIMRLWTDLFFSLDWPFFKKWYITISILNYIRSDNGVFFLMFFYFILFFIHLFVFLILFWPDQNQPWNFTFE